MKAKAQEHSDHLFSLVNNRLKEMESDLEIDQIRFKPKQVAGDNCRYVTVCRKVTNPRTGQTYVSCNQELVCN